MGAIHWGLAMKTSSASDSARWYALGVLPALVGWFALLLPSLPALILLAVAFTSALPFRHGSHRLGINVCDCR
jgi:hypothetical protein